MAKYVVDSASLTPIADETRTIDGVTSGLTLEAIASKLNSANSEIGSQVNLISQIKELLDGKAGRSEIVHGYFVPADTSVVITNAYSDEPYFIGFCEYGVGIYDKTHTTIRTIMWVGVKSYADSSAAGQGLRLYAAANSSSMTSVNPPYGAMFMGENAINFDGFTAGIACGSKTLAFKGLIPGRTYLYVAVSAGGA